MEYFQILKMRGTVKNLKSNKHLGLTKLSHKFEYICEYLFKIIFVTTFIKHGVLNKICVLLHKISDLQIIFVIIFVLLALYVSGLALWASSMSA